MEAHHQLISLLSRSTLELQELRRSACATALQQLHIRNDLEFNTLDEWTRSAASLIQICAPVALEVQRPTQRCWSPVSRWCYGLESDTEIYDLPDNPSIISSTPMCVSLWFPLTISANPTEIISMVNQINSFMPHITNSQSCNYHHSWLVVTTDITCASVFPQQNTSSYEFDYNAISSTNVSSGSAELHPDTGTSLDIGVPNNSTTYSPDEIEFVDAFFDRRIL